MQKLELVNLHLQDFGLNVKICNHLNKSNIFTVGDLIELTELDLMSISGLGTKSIQKIKMSLAEKNLSLNSKGFGTPLEQLKLTSQSFHALKRNGFNYVEELQNKSDQELLSLRGFSKDSLNKLQKKLNELPKIINS